MTAIHQKTLKRRVDEDLRAGPEILKVVIYDLKESCPDNCFELRGEDEKGLVHFSFRDPKKLVVFDEFDVTMSDLEHQYELVECAEGASPQ